jgi:hypothetical protein
MNEVEDATHIFVCPALRVEHLKIQISMEDKLKRWKVPFSDKYLESVEERTCRKWFNTARTTKLDGKRKQELSPDRLWRLVKGYWRMNQKANLKQFLVNLNAAIRKTGSCLTQECEMNCALTVQHDLLTILAQRLQLQIEGETNALHRSLLFQEWCSSEQADTAFGSRGSIHGQNLSGHNSFILLYNLESKVRMKVIELLRTWLSSKKPTRALIIIQRKEIEQWFRPRDRRFLEIGYSASFPLVHSTAHCTKPTLIRANDDVSIVLALNKESMALDPIDWPALKK